MKNTILYIATVLIWGSTWLAIEFQLGEASVLTSVFYRFAIAAAVMWLYCLWAKVPLNFSVKNHGYIALLALFNFSMNYVLIYSSQKYLTSAMTSIAFSTMLLMNIVNTRLFFGSQISARVYLGALLGIFGLVALFWNDLATNDENSLLGLALVLASALVASLGNMASVRNSRAGMNVLAVNAWGMLYGALALALIVIATGTGFDASWTPAYTGSLLYLAIFGTVIAFATYYVLLNEMGPEKASYSIVLFPMVAVVLSSLFEDFVWSANTFIGFALVLLGNVVILTPVAKIRQRIAAFKTARIAA
ncbi:DMT family transporter [Arenicella sp. 4NH20-0111]|uniref:DMT family transporter n=1 Tax=Arenicella sp. 4NH20-0111 TaxID=3127648 RepID=UPI0033424E8A